MPSAVWKSEMNWIDLGWSHNLFGFIYLFVHLLFIFYKYRIWGCVMKVSQGNFMWLNLSKCWVSLHKTSGTWTFVVWRGLSKLCLAESKIFLCLGTNLVSTSWKQRLFLSTYILFLRNDLCNPSTYFATPYIFLYFEKEKMLWFYYNFQNVLLTLRFIFIISVHLCVFVWLNVACVLILTEAREGYLIPWNWSPRKQ